MSKRNVRILVLSSFLLALLFIGGYIYLQGPLQKVSPTPIQRSSMGVLELTRFNYSSEVKDVAEEYDLPEEYLLALIVLETSGSKPAGKRYEPGVYRRLVQLKNGERSRYESVRKHHLDNASEEAVRNLATSWGPFQLMGYKCIAMDIHVKDLRGGDAVENGVKWIAEEYGHLLRKKRFKDAFHYHNTGRLFPKVGKPKTHDPQYVNKGLGYMEYFRNSDDS